MFLQLLGINTTLFLCIFAVFFVVFVFIVNALNEAKILKTFLQFIPPSIHVTSIYGQFENFQISVACEKVNASFSTVLIILKRLPIKYA